MAKSKRKIKKLKKREPGNINLTVKFMVLFGTLVLLLLALSPYFFPKDRFQEAKEQVLHNPKDIGGHLLLTEEFLKNNQLQEAQNELLVAQHLQKESRGSVQVLGATSRIAELWQNWSKQNPSEIQKEIEKWEKLVVEIPSYRDGWLNLAFYSYKLDRKYQAKEYLQKAIELDPNYETTRMLEAVFK